MTDSRRLAGSRRLGTQHGCVRPADPRLSGYVTPSHQASMGAPSLDFQRPQTMATVLGSLFLAGATIGGLSLILPHPSQYETGELWSNVVLAYVAGAAILLARNRLTVWSFQLLVLAGTVVVTRAVYYGHDPSGYYTFWYLWIGVYSVFFFGPRLGSLQVVAVGVAYAWI